MLERTEITADIFESGTMLLVSVTFTLFMIGRVDAFYSLVFIMLLIVFVLVGNYFNTKMWVLRKERYKIRADLARDLIKIIMSKIEILSL